MDYFENTYEYRWSNTEDITNFKMYHNAAEKLNVSFSTPILSCYGCLGSGWSKLFEMNVITRVYRTQTQKIEQLDSGMYRYREIEGTRQLVGEYKSGPTSISSANNATYYASGNKAYLRMISPASETEGSKATSWSDYYTISNVLAEVQNVNHRTISFEVEALTDSEIESGLGFKYDIECFANPINSNAMFGSYYAVHSGTYSTPSVFPIVVYKYTWSISSGLPELVDPSSCKITNTLYHQDTSVTENGGPLITKGVKYSAYQLLRKALLTCDTYIIENGVECLDEYTSKGEKLNSLKYPIIINKDWINRLQVAKINETIFQCNNLWEVLLQIGYYLHAIPYLYFAKDGTDRFELSFKQLGKSDFDTENSENITVFNSQNLSEYFTQYDSYVTNLFSPQNEIEEWIVSQNK